MRKRQRLKIEKQQKQAIAAILDKLTKLVISRVELKVNE